MNWARILGGLLFATGSTICFGFALGLAYETIAYVTGIVPTISDVTVQTVINHKTFAYVAFLLAGLLIGALAAHFGDWIP